jgi:hypothetical protein
MPGSEPSISAVLAERAFQQADAPAYTFRVDAIEGELTEQYRLDQFTRLDVPL